MFKIKRLGKMATHLTLGLLAASISVSSYASFAKSNATSFMLLYIDKAYPLLSQVSTLAKLFYVQYGNCPSNGRLQLKLPDNSVFSKVTNYECVALATYKTIGVPTPLKGVTIGMAPSYVPSTKRWSFDEIIYATNLYSLPGEFQPLPGSSSAMLSLSEYFIGGVYAADPKTYLSKAIERQPPKL